MNANGREIAPADPDMNGLLPTSGVLGMLALLGAAVWILMDVRDRLRPRVFLFIAAIPLYGFLCGRVLAAENALLPLKFDYPLNAIDQAMGFSAAAVAQAVRVGPMLPVLCEIYRSLLIAMAFWYGLSLKYAKMPSIMKAYIVEMIAGPCLYALLPACGPFYAFRGFPWSSGLHALQSLQLSGDPNAVPSLHMATAVLLIIFAPARRWRVLAVLYSGATAVATLATGEHYVTDLLIALPFACFAAALAYRRISTAAAWLALVALWMCAIRRAAAWLVAHPASLRICAVLTAAAAIYGIVTFGRRPAAEITSVVPTTASPVLAGVE